MATEVLTGHRPKFKAKLAPGKYGCVILGRYTKTDRLTAAGVAHVEWNSNRKVKRQAELLGMRSAFVCWFVVEYERLGGTWKEAVDNIRSYPFRRLRRQILKRRRQKKRML